MGHGLSVYDTSSEAEKRILYGEALAREREAVARERIAKEEERLAKNEIESHQRKYLDLLDSYKKLSLQKNELLRAKQKDEKLREQQAIEREKNEEKLSEARQNEAEAQQELWCSQQNEARAKEKEMEARQNEKEAKLKEAEARQKEVKAENKLNENQLSILQKENEFLNLKINKCDILINGCRNDAKHDDFVAKKPDNLVVLIGQSGNGKSTVGNRLLQDNSDDADQLFTTSDDFTEGCTEKATHKFLDYDGDDEDDEKSVLNGNLCVVDTVGGSDPDEKKMDAFSINDTMDHLKGSGGVNYFIFVLSSTGRFNPTLAKLLNQYSSTFGKGFWDHLIVVFTHCDSEKACKRFMKKNVEATRKLIGEKIPNSKVDNIIFIPIGIDCYTDQINEIYKKINGSNKISIDLLVTPYDKAVTDKANLKTEYDKNLDKIKQLQN